MPKNRSIDLLKNEILKEKTCFHTNQLLALLVSPRKSANTQAFEMLFNPLPGVPGNVEVSNFDLLTLHGFSIEELTNALNFDNASNFIELLDFASDKKAFIASYPGSREILLDCVRGNKSPLLFITLSSILDIRECKEAIIKQSLFYKLCKNMKSVNVNDLVFMPKIRSVEALDHFLESPITFAKGKAKETLLRLFSENSNMEKSPSTVNKKRPSASSSDSIQDENEFAPPKKRPV